MFLVFSGLGIWQDKPTFLQKVLMAYCETGRFVNQ